MMIPNLDWPLASEFLRNIKEFTDEDAEFANVPNSIKDACTFKNGVYALPCRLNLQGYFVNTTVLESKLNIRKKNSIQNCLALVIAAAIMLIPANVFPIMITNSLGNESTSTIFEGIVYMWDSGSYHIAALIFIASIIVPISKILILLL